jgi:hypothetical protein
VHDVHGAFLEISANDDPWPPDGGLISAEPIVRKPSAQVAGKQVTRDPIAFDQVTYEQVTLAKSVRTVTRHFGAFREGPQEIASWLQLSRLLTLKK